MDDGMVSTDWRAGLLAQNTPALTRLRALVGALRPDECMYLGTWESGYILKFDPKQMERGLQNLGKPSETETYIWQFAIGPD
ncbi:MAG TPA: hypothetical protein PLT94_15230, partial [Rhodocyclaceae bacterium]|nr:hypothetical protein [Rhodocyclaceae bacterium]